MSIFDISPKLQDQKANVDFPTHVYNASNTNKTKAIRNVVKHESRERNLALGAKNKPLPTHQLFRGLKATCCRTIAIASIGEPTIKNTRKPHKLRD